MHSDDNNVKSVELHAPPAHRAKRACAFYARHFLSASTGDEAAAGADAKKSCSERPEHHIFQGCLPRSRPHYERISGRSFKECDNMA